MVVWPHHSVAVSILSALLALLRLSGGARYPGPCTGLNPIDLLQRVVSPRGGALPPGVEVRYDAAGSVHALRLTPRAGRLSFPAAALFFAGSHCRLFPEEFSLLVTLKLQRAARPRAQCLFALMSPAAGGGGSRRPKVGVRLRSDGRVRVDYGDGRRRRRRRAATEFADVGLTDGRWHTLVVSVTARRVVLRTDCGPRRSKRLRRRWPALIDAGDDNVHVGNCNGEKGGLFTGLLRQLILLPGADLGPYTCPPRTSTGPDGTQQNRTGGDLFSTSAAALMSDSACTWRNTGKMWFDIYRKRLNICYSGVWQPALLPPSERTRRRLDFVVWHQDVVTAAPTIDIEVFRVPHEGLFMATASFDGDDLKKRQSAIFKWEEGRFRLYQSLYTLGAQGWEHFQIGDMFFLAVANHGARRETPSKSVIYRWNRKRKRFRVYQEIVTWTARDIEYFRIDQEHFIIVANHLRGDNHSISSTLFAWNVTSLRFVERQRLPTVGAYDWTHFRLDGYHLLVVANSFSGPPRRTTRVDSVIYFWQSGSFLPFQTLQTTGATDWEFFRIHDDFFLVVANAYNYGPHASALSEPYMTNSTVYRLNKRLKRFEPYQDIVTHSAVDWESFTVGEDTYLIVSNAQQHDVDRRNHANADDPAAAAAAAAPLTSSAADSAAAHSLARSRSVIYRWQGTEKFVPVHYLDTLPSADWESFDVDGDTYLVYANAKDSISQVYRVKLV